MICDLSSSHEYEMAKLCREFENMSISRVNEHVSLDERIDRPLEFEYVGQIEPLGLDDHGQFDDADDTPSIPEHWHDWEKHAFLDIELEMYYMHWLDDMDVNMDSDVYTRRCGFFRGDTMLCGYAEDFKKGGKYYATEM
jgi:hypothetical protein